MVDKSAFAVRLRRGYGARRGKGSSNGGEEEPSP
jgi:hypothetical protein